MTTANFNHKAIWTGDNLHILRGRKAGTVILTGLQERTGEHLPLPGTSIPPAGEGARSKGA